MRLKNKLYLLALFAAACGRPNSNEDKGTPQPVTISTANILPIDIVTYAKSLKGVPYKYGSINPAQGFDCSGFITYVFNHFGINVPRTSVDFTFAGREVALDDAQTGDLILFTGTDTTHRIVGHMGIILTSPGEELKFIHSTSGRDLGVTETAFNAYYRTRYVKTIRLFFYNDLLRPDKFL